MNDFNIRKIEVEDSTTHETIFKGKDLEGKKGLLQFLLMILRKYGENFEENINEAIEYGREFDAAVMRELKKLIGK